MSNGLRELIADCSRRERFRRTEQFLDVLVKYYLKKIIENNEVDLKEMIEDARLVSKQRY